MIRIENQITFGWEEAIRGMRNPMNSWEQSDTSIYDGGVYELVVGNKDLELMRKLRNAGADHGKFMRMIVAYMDIVAPLYWWKEFDTYKVGTVANSCSTMHKIHAKEFTIDDFSHEHLDDCSIELLENIIYNLNVSRNRFNGDVALCDGTTQKDHWWQMIQLLPTSYNQRRTVQMNYEVLRNVYHARKNHKLDEWREFCKMIEGLPYAKELIVGAAD